MNEKQTIKRLRARILELESRELECHKTEEKLRASRQRYITLIDTLPHGIQECTVDGEITFSNSAHHRILGYADGELIGQKIWDLLADEEAKAVFPGMLAELAVEQPAPEPYIAENRTRNGRIIHVQVDWNYKYDPQGRVAGFIAVVTDISGPLSATRALEESERRYRTLFEKAGQAIFIIDAEGPDIGRIIDCNQAAAEMHGYTKEEITKMNIWDLDAPEDAGKAGDRIQKMMYGEWVQAEINHCRKDGSQFPLEMSAGLIIMGSQKRILAFDRDITSRKEAERRLRKSEELYRAIFEGSGEGIILVNAQTLQFRHANPAICSFLGYSLEELTRLSVPEVHPEEVRQQIVEGCKSQTKEQIHLLEEIPCRHKDGHVVYADIRTSLIDLDGRPHRVGFFTDITARMGIKKTLQEQILFLQTLIDTLPHPIFYKDVGGRYLGCNQAFETFLGLNKDDIIGKTEHDLTPGDIAESCNNADKDLFNSRKPQTYEATMQFADGIRREVLLNKAVFYHQDGSLAGMVGAMIDISDQKRAEKEKALQEKQLRQAQKMEAIGTLAGGIAHDFNNILSAIVGYTDIALHELRPDSAVYGYLKKVLKASERARSLVYQILTFSRATEKENRPVVLKYIAKETLKLLRATLPSTISIEAKLYSDAAIHSDPTHLHQVMMNLCTNAAHAMQDNGGQLTVTLEEAVPDENIQGLDSDRKTGRYLKLSVSDTGSGIDPDIIDRIFDPFFTTKKPGEGTGMGLAVVHGIIKECGGAIHVQSTPHRGTVFDVWLPVIEVEREAARPVESSLPVGDEHILFVDDEPDIVAVGLQMLELLGYRVTAIEDSDKALDVFRDAPHEVDLVITDMTMPNMTGDVLSRRLLQIRPDLPIIICTGYSEKISENNIQSLGIAGIAYKPLIMKDLAELIRKTLDDRKSCQSAL